MVRASTHPTRLDARIKSGHDIGRGRDALTSEIERPLPPGTLLPGGPLVGVGAGHGDPHGAGRASQQLLGSDGLEAGVIKRELGQWRGVGVGYRANTGRKSVHRGTSVLCQEPTFGCSVPGYFVR